MPVPACAVLLGAIAYHAAPYVPEALERLQGFFEGPIARVSDLEKLPELYRTRSLCSPGSRTRSSSRARGVGQPPTGEARSIVQDLAPGFVEPSLPGNAVD
jgi:hypothetical protein